MKRLIGVTASLSAFLVTVVSQAQTTVPKEIDLGISRNVSGVLSNSVLGLSGCPTTLCVTGLVPVVSCTNIYTPTYHCYTNTVIQLTGCTTTLVSYVYCHTNLVNCTTNNGTITCTAIVTCQTNTYPRLSNCTTNYVPQIHCYTYTNHILVCTTNLAPHVTCTNDFGGAAVFRVVQHVKGSIAANPECDELAGYFASNATFEASMYAHLQQPDWRGYHYGYFVLRNGTNVLASGTINGSNGVGSHGALEPCAVCGHLEGTWVGTILRGALKGYGIQATYAGEVPPENCSPNAPPEGPFTMTIDGVVIVTNCLPQTVGGQ
jgi:hypothetical protein